MLDEEQIVTCFLVCKQPSNVDVGGRGGGVRGTVYISRRGRELVSKPAISLKKSRGGGGAVVERHHAKEKAGFRRFFGLKSPAI